MLTDLEQVRLVVTALYPFGPSIYDQNDDSRYTFGVSARIGMGITDKGVSALAWALVMKEPVRITQRDLTFSSFAYAYIVLGLEHANALSPNPPPSVLGLGHTSGLRARFETAHGTWHMLSLECAWK